MVDSKATEISTYFERDLAARLRKLQTKVQFFIG